MIKNWLFVQRIKLFARFSITSVFNSAFAISSLIPIYWFLGDKLSLFVCLAIAHLANLLVSYLTHKFFTFRQKALSVAEGVFFFVYQNTMFLISSVTTVYIVEVIEISPLFVQPPLVFSFGVINFFVYEKLVFVHTRAN